MNHVYRLVFNSSRGLIQVASELGSVEDKHRGRKRTPVKDTKRERRGKPARTPIAVALVLALGVTIPMLSMTPAQATTALSSMTGVSGGNGGNGTATAGGAGGTGTGGSTYANQGGNGAYLGAGGGGGGYGTRGVGYGPIIHPYDYGSGGYGGAGGGYGGYAGGGGGGGGGGAPAKIFSTASYQLGSGKSLIGGSGGAGGKAFYSSTASEYVAMGGSGGSGAAAVSGEGFSLISYGTIRGGAGGIAANGYYGGSGGFGGTGIYIGQASSLPPATTYITNGSASNPGALIAGGAAGASGQAFGGYGDHGANGGVGIYAYGASGYLAYGGTSVPQRGLVLTNYGTITGGTGGAGGKGSSTSGRNGVGGSGIAGSYMIVVNEASGKIYGGKGGTGTSSFGGYGGAGIYSHGGAIITNSGTIAGGLDGSGSGYHGYAVRFNGNNNTLKLLAGYSLVGGASCLGSGSYSNNTLELGGSANGIMNGSMGSYGTAKPNFFDFDYLRKTGSSTWTVTTTTSTSFNLGIPIWEIDDGVLQVANGDNYNSESYYGIGFGIKPTSSTTTTPGVDNGELDVTGSAKLNGESVKVWPASGNYVDGVKYDLVHAAGGVNGNFGTISYYPTLPASVTPTITYTSTDVYLTFSGSGTVGSSGGGTSGGGTSGGTSGSTSSGGGGAVGLLSLFGLLGLAGFGRARTSYRWD